MGDKREAVIFVMGPTASGKTELAMQLADQLHGDIISVDSALIYRGMDIGTAKPTPSELERYPHALVDICDPSESYSASEFSSDAQREIERILPSGRIPILAGGTMLYFRALEQGLSPLPEADMEVRRRLEEEADKKGWEALHQELKIVDPLAAARIHPNDPQRLQRALEVYRISGKPMSLLWEEKGTPFPYKVIKVGLTTSERSVLHRRIEDRYLRMLKEGFIEEVTSLKDRGDLSIDLPSMRCVGYRQVWDYLDGEYSYDEMVMRGSAATRQLAKRQLTWLRKEEGLYWLQTDAEEWQKQGVAWCRASLDKE